MPEVNLENEHSGENLKFFSLPLVNDNPFGWGPNDQPDKYKDLPYQKFSKSDKIGKIADWSLTGHTDKKSYNKYQSQFSVGNVGQYSYFHDEDESQFTLVDQTRVVKTGFQKKFRTYPNVRLIFGKNWKIIFLIEND